MTHSEELEHLSELHRKGDLTDEEFAAEKKRLIETPDPPALNTVVVNSPPKKSSGIAKGCGIGCLGLIVVFVIAMAIGSNDRGGSGSNSPSPDDEKRDAYIGAQIIVEHYLKAPSTADFPYSGDASITRNSDGSYTIYSYVDSQNSFGAKIRTHFTITVRGSGDNWKEDAPPQFENVE
jgi:hypothetical protein